ncbi:dehydrogenase/reductase SDR family member 4 [Xylocopa sonorina]|uniref:dehydrogenase/reductase SDR family member 4 n=1 Tax=Xylocopa sonorina TaxID=1818115 RepID=UPI00403B053D
MLRTSVSQNMKQLNRNITNITCKRLEGRIAIVTASTDGIGFAIAKRLAQEGAKVIISSRKEANVKRAVDQLQSEGLTVSGIVCHVGIKEDRKALFEKAEREFGGLDILVSNAAINPVPSTLFETSEQVWDKIFDINVKSTFFLMQESLPLLRKGKSPSIILVSSVAGYQSFSILGAYSVSKTAMLGLNKAAALNLASDGIRVNCIAPGVIKTRFSQVLTTDEVKHQVLSTIPMGKYGMPDEVAPLAAFLASDDASYITGETIIAAGGMQCRL